MTSAPASLRLILVGKQGAGKGTQAVRLSDHFGIPHISTGDVFRAAVSSGTDLGYRVKSVIDIGELVSDELTGEVVRERLSQSDAGNGFLLDGYPRNERQVADLDAMLAPNEVDLVIDLEVPTDVAIERLSSRRVCSNCGAIYGADNMPKNPLVCDICGGEVVQRDDDKPEAIRQRLALYEEQTSPMLSHYRQQGKVATVEGLGTADEVFARLVAAIEDGVALETTISN